MAQRTIVEHIDDLDGTTGEDVATVEFSVDHSTYAIDLSADNQGTLRHLLAPYITAGRKLTGKASFTRTTSSNGAGPAKRDPQQTKAIRDWARGNSYQISDRGRIPTQVEAAYNANDPSLLHIGAAPLASVG